MVVRDEASLIPTPYLLDESSNRDESLSRKRRRMEIRKDMAMDAYRSRASQTTLVPRFMADAILAGRSPQME